MNPMQRKLTERDIDTLASLRAACDNYISLDNYRDGWVRPMDVGGSNGSHHSQSLAKLARRDLCDRKKFGGLREKGSCRYRINEAGRKFLADRRAAAAALHRGRAMLPRGGRAG